MGVTGLWTVVQPCARPIKIDTLNKKRLAVDASIWIYQFLKAVRDKEGNALRNSHVVGFFRRICKLLFYGIKPVFVFDGGAPILKRQTISGRKSRREGRRDDAVRTAGKLLALQMQRRAEDEEQQRKDEATRPMRHAEEEALPDDLVYVDELQMTQQERSQNRKFKKKDQYHLPELEMPLAEMGGPNDPRVMSLEELEHHARQFDTGEDISIYDFSKIDFNSDFFTSLPATDRYNILNAARLRSRLRMGYSKDQLETMFPDRMAFSRFQIERVTERNELTQRLMQVGTADDGKFGLDDAGRVAGEKGREYVLVKNAGVEGGWALGVIGDKDKEEGKRSKPIDLDEVERRAKEEDNEDAEGSSHVPSELSSDEILKRRQAFYESRKPNVAFTSTVSARGATAEVATSKTSPSKSISQTGREVLRQEEDQLFIADEDGGLSHSSLEETSDSEDEETQLQLAIAMSLQSNDDSEIRKPIVQPPQQKAAEMNPFASGRGTVASIANREARRVAPPVATRDDDFVDDEITDLEDALAESRQSKQQPQTILRKSSSPKRKEWTLSTRSASVKTPPEKKFAGPLPFEKLDLGSSLLGKRKMKKVEEANSGGFEKNAEKSEESVTAPPWFSADLEKGMEAQRAIEEEERYRDRKAEEAEQFRFLGISDLSRQKSLEVVDVDEVDARRKEPINIESSDDEEEEDTDEVSRQIDGKDERVSGAPNLELNMNDLADKVRAEPPMVENQFPGHTPHQITYTNRPPAAASPKHQGSATGQVTSPQARPQDQASVSPALDEIIASENGDIEPETESESSSRSESPDVFMPDGAMMQSIAADHEAAAERADVDMDNTETTAINDTDDISLPVSDEANQANVLDDSDAQDYSDQEDEELMTQLAVEAEEHARFASTLNNRSQRQNAEDYEKELKALRTQQKKDRRDADEVTHVMVSECQQLLKLFGLPYITAPMEAEAQCAELVHMGLVDGIVTDDSDIFLFGGTRIYKNMFNAAKFVECYLTADLVRDFDLTRSKLINIAHLLGSDYTEGLPGVGPVTALEILTEFPNGLSEFREWWSGVQMGGPVSDADRASPFRRKFRKNITKLFLPPAFPDARVELAYTNPEVDKDPSAFQWGVPDLDALRSFLMATIGWNQERTDEVLVPVVRDMNRRMNEGTQANITAFLGGSGTTGPSVGAGAFAPRVRKEGKSRRMESALERMAEGARKKRKLGGAEFVPIDEVGDANVAAPVTTSTKRGKPKRRATAVLEDVDESAGEDTNSEDADTLPIKRRKAQPRNKRRSKANTDA